MVDLFWDSSPLDRKKFAHEKRLRSVRQSQGTVLYRTVQRHREGPDANGATHTERGPGPSNTTLPYCTNLPAGTVQRKTQGQVHREGPDANRATHTERGPGPSKTTQRHRPPHWPERRPGHTRTVPVPYLLDSIHSLDTYNYYIIILVKLYV